MGTTVTGALEQNARLVRDVFDETGSGAERAPDEYLRNVERLAHAVLGRALEEGWLSYLSDDDDQTPLKRSINELARNLRHVHDDGDGCLDEGNG